MPSQNTLILDHELQAELQQARQASVEALLGQLRLRGAILLYIGQDVDKFEQEIAENFGCEVALAVSNSLFALDNAPLPPEMREEIRNATNYGMSRW